MGYVVHTALLVTIDTFEEKVPVEVKYIYDTVKRLMGKYSCLVTELHGYMLGTYSFAVLPDGQKERWTVSDEVDECRDRVEEFLSTVEHNRPRGNKDMVLFGVDWVEINYGGDSGCPEIMDDNSECGEQKREWMLTRGRND